jgi:hypothetical protein
MRFRLARFGGGGVIDDALVRSDAGTARDVRLVHAVVATDCRLLGELLAEL